MSWLIAVSVALSAEVVVGQLTPTPQAGGPGGAPGGVMCPGDSLVVGMDFDYGDLYGNAAVWNLRLHCRRPDVVMARIRPAGVAWDTDPIGTVGGDVPMGFEDADCPSDTWLVGGTVHSDAYVAGIAPHCAALRWSEGVVESSPSQVQPLMGRTDDDATSLACGPGEAVVGAAVLSGWVVDRLGWICGALEAGAANCGDGAVDVGEECDDGSPIGGDGCHGCAVEDGWLCDGEPSVCDLLDDTDPIPSDTARADTGTIQPPSTGDTGGSTTGGPTDTAEPPGPGQTDRDRDGFAVGDGDCDDSDPSVHPSATDAPGDGIDQNCSGHDARQTWGSAAGCGCGPPSGAPPAWWLWIGVPAWLRRSRRGPREARNGAQMSPVG